MSPKAAKPLVLTGDLDIFSIRPQWEGLCAKVPASGKVVLDLSAVEDFDLSGLQLLLAARRQVEAGGGQMVWRGLPPAVCERLRNLGCPIPSGEEAP